MSSVTGAASVILFVRPMRKLGYLLVLLAAPFFFRTAFEMYFLTVMHGPQMLFFSLMHTAGPALLLVLACSGVSFLLLALYSVIACGRLILRKTTGEHEKTFTWILGLQLLHIALLCLYDYWSPIFEGGA